MPKSSKAQGTTRAKSKLANEVIVENILNGASQNDIADLLGVSRQAVGNKITNSQDVRTALANARSELSSATQITRADAIAGIMEAIDMAKLCADPASMIRGWSEIAKMLGYYAPEVKKLEITATGDNLVKKYEQMSDDELMEVAYGNKNPPIEGQFTRTEH